VSSGSLPAYSASLRNFLVIPSTESEGAVMVMAMSGARNFISSSPCTRTVTSQSIGTSSPTSAMVVLGEGKGK
jgi:hypothetical protein